MFYFFVFTHADKYSIFKEVEGEIIVLGYIMWVGTSDTIGVSRYDMNLEVSTKEEKYINDGSVCCGLVMKSWRAFFKILFDTPMEYLYCNQAKAVGMPNQGGCLFGKKKLHM